MRPSLLVVFLILLNYINGQPMELIAGHVLFRHGARTPYITYPTDPMKEKDWPNGYGLLTTTGIEQCHRLGQYLRHRYDSILSANYTPSEIVVRSTNYNRTIMSAQLVLTGLYSLSNTSDDKVLVQSIPIHTTPITEDFLLAENICPRYEEIKQQIYQTDEFMRINQCYEPFFQKLGVWTDISNIDMRNVQDVANTLLIEYDYNKAPAWVDANVRKNLSVVFDLSTYFLFYNDDTKRIRGGPVIQDMWLNMNSASHGNSFRKVKMYSAHDSAISAVLSFLRVNYAQQPQYASALFVDLYKQNASYFVKVEYLNVTDSNKAYPYLLDGCPAVECPLDIFTAIYQPRFPASAEVECAKKTPPTPPGGDGNNKKLIVVLSVVVFGVILILIGIFVFLYRRRSEHYSPLLSAGSGAQTISSLK